MVPVVSIYVLVGTTVINRVKDYEIVSIMDVIKHDVRCDVYDSSSFITSMVGKTPENSYGNLAITISSVRNLYKHSLEVSITNSKILFCFIVNFYVYLLADADHVRMCMQHS